MGATPNIYVNIVNYILFSFSTASLIQNQGIYFRSLGINAKG